MSHPDNKPFRSWSLLLAVTTRLLRGLILAGLGLMSGGCVNVKPWERDDLAAYGMRPDRDTVSIDLREHMWFSREASNGGRSIGGGGCGCN